MCTNGTDSPPKSSAIVTLDSRHIWEIVSQKARHRTELINGIPPPNRWPIRAKELMGKTIPPIGYLNVP